MRLYEVGGCVRDEILGVKSKDIDYTVVLEPNETSRDPFNYVVDELRLQGFEIFLTSPAFLTVRARFPRSWNNGLTADFVLARKESGYSDGRRPDHVEPGTLEDDLNRRDFTMNAIAKDYLGDYIDPHGGIEDIRKKTIRAVGDPLDRLIEDPLRALRAMRFNVTKGFGVDTDLYWAIREPRVVEGIRATAEERIMDELNKMFRFDTLSSIRAIDRFPEIRDVIFAGRVSLEATMKTKGRG